MRAHDCRQLLHQNVLDLVLVKLQVHLHLQAICCLDSSFLLVTKKNRRRAVVPPNQPESIQFFLVSVQSLTNDNDKLDRWVQILTLWSVFIYLSDVNAVFVFSISRITWHKEFWNIGYSLYIRVMLTIVCKSYRIIYYCFHLLIILQLFYTYLFNCH